jgi:uncharacterized OsmC-like protein
MRAATLPVAAIESYWNAPSKQGHKRMNREQLRSVQAPWKEKYRQDPDSARQTLRAVAELNLDSLSCRLSSTAPDPLLAGLHPLTGGTGEHACSAEMLLQALAGCAAITLSAVTTAMGLAVTGGRVIAEGDLDFRGTLGVDRETPVGFTDIRLNLELDTTASREELDKLVSMTERYCVVFQTLAKPPRVMCTAEAIG